MYGLPQAGILANKLLQKRLAPDGYYDMPQHTWTMETHTSIGTIITSSVQLWN